MGSNCILSVRTRSLSLSPPLSLSSLLSSQGSTLFFGQEESFTQWRSVMREAPKREARLEEEVSDGVSLVCATGKRRQAVFQSRSTAQEGRRRWEDKGQKGGKKRRVGRQ